MIYQECQTAVGGNIVEIVDVFKLDIFIRNIMVRIFLLVQTQHLNHAVQMWEMQNVGNCLNVIDEVGRRLDFKKAEGLESTWLYY